MWDTVLQGSRKLKKTPTGQGTKLSCHVENFFSLVEKSNRRVYEEKSPLAMATAFTEICDKYVVLVHVSFFAGIAQAQTKQ